MGTLILAKAALLALGIAGLSACASGPSTRPIASIAEVLDRPRAGEVVTANLGDTLLERGALYWVTALRTGGPTQIDSGIGNVVVAPPGVYHLKAEDDATLFYEGGPPVQSGIATAVWTGGGLCVDKAARRVSGMYWIRGNCGSKNLIAPSFVETRAIDDVATDLWRKEIIYNGRSGDTIRMIYREFTASDIARPAYTQELQYDLSQQSDIGLREVRIAIEEASNTSIRYRVLQTFDGNPPVR